MALIPPSVPSLCIPRVFQNITKERVAYVFKSLGLGEIDHIDMVPRTSENGDKFQRVFVHFKRWFGSKEAVRARERVLSGKEIKIVYDDPWFWKISANRSMPRAPDSRPSGDSRAPDRPRPRIVDDSASSDNDEKLRTNKSTSQHRRPHSGKPHQNRSRPRNDRGDAPRHATVADTLPREFAPQSPRDPPPAFDVDAPADEGGAWTTINYGNVTEIPKVKRRVVKKPQMKVKEDGEVKEDSEVA